VDGGPGPRRGDGSAPSSLAPGRDRHGADDVGGVVDADTVVEVSGLVRRFGSATALDGVDLTIGRGHLFAVLGHNGAGKTTLLRLLNGLLRPTAGDVRVFGRDPFREGGLVRARSGAVTESTTLDEFLTVRETLHAYGRLFEVPRSRLDARVEELVELFELGAHADQPARELSAGMRQRAAFARGLVHGPELLLLDEPTANLDPIAAHRVRVVVADLARRSGSTVVMSTHNLAEAQDVCDHVAVLRHGRVLVQGTIDELSRAAATAVHTRVSVTSDPGVAADTLDAFGEVQRDGAPHVLVVTHARRDEVPRMVAALVSAGVEVDGVTTLAPTLEDMYLDLHREGADA
jgi:ABC-2 type transport system ATP-binding protein